jgi:hypothetical protein
VKKPKPWWQTYPKEYWTPEDRRAAIKDGWRPPPTPLKQEIDPMLVAQPTHLAPAWSPLSPPKRVGVGAQGRAVDQLLHDMGIR